MDINIVIDKLAEQGMLRPNRKIGDYYSCYCPFHNDGNERKPSSGILLHDQYRNGQMYPAGWFNCFTCHHSYQLPDFISELLKIHSIHQTGKAWLEENIEGYNHEVEFEPLIPEDMMNGVNNAFAIMSIKDKMKTEKPSYISEQELAKYRFTVDYMYSRKLTDEVIEKFDVGFDANFLPTGRKKKIPCVTFPVRDVNGNTLFICRRSVEGKAFYLPSKVEKSVYGLYELPRGCESVIIAESCFNVLTCYVYGYPAVGLLGTGTPRQIAQLKRLGVKEFVLGMDPDEAGDSACRRLKNALKDVALVRRMVDIPIGKDINDLSKEEFVNIYNNRI